MDKGVIQQAGTARELYDRPANAFVASFIGSPPMNVLPANVESSEHGLTLRIGNGYMAVPPPLRDAVAAHSGRSVVFGLRPEHIAGLRRQAGAAGLAATRRRGSSIVENLGAEKLVHFRLGERQLIARMPAEATLIDSGHGRLVFNLNRLHLFDPETTVRLSA